MFGEPPDASGLQVPDGIIGGHGQQMEPGSDVRAEKAQDRDQRELKQ